VNTSDFSIALSFIIHIFVMGEIGTPESSRGENLRQKYFARRGRALRRALTGAEPSKKDTRPPIIVLKGRFPGVKAAERKAAKQATKNGEVLPPHIIRANAHAQDEW
jgi:hypothetical protein